ncbi:3',5'-cyclic-AMP phosphodiesterase [Candidatus Photodesmus anomalopis]|uniref:3',5'-cyclic-AMP phosphodiesterase n=1 Tax=Candidatus Photodesmus anomalopis TaxID=28176 RepID=UPI00054F24BF|nr:3',5'-cyclic-AMP phosphodiesterase [Candidatus Photodesmus katoptron]
MRLSLNLTNSSSIKLLQITDTHLFAPEDGSLLNVITLDSFQAVLGAIIEKKFQFDVIVATGDISQDHSEESYQHFVDSISVLKQPCFWLAGNHDYKPSMAGFFRPKKIFNLEHAFLSENWQIIILDSQVFGVSYGHLSKQQMLLLDSILREYHHHHTLILLHHHPILVGSDWLDRHALKDSIEFWQILRKYSNVKAILCGHVHQNIDRDIQNIRVLSAPSTCIQFKPNSKHFALDRLSPGWREIELYDDGSISTQVHRLMSTYFLPDLNTNGY